MCSNGFSRVDPAIRWQTMRDLQDAPESAWRAEQERVAAEGGAPRLLAHRDQGGRWTPRLYGKKWLPTTYSLLLLRELGLPRADPRARASCAPFSKRDWVAMAASISPPAAR